MPKQPCVEKIFDGYRSYPCRRTGTVEYEGKWFCFQHNPVAVAARRNKRSNKWDAERAVEIAQADLHSAEKLLLEDCLLHLTELPFSVFNRAINARGAAVRLDYAKEALAKLKEEN